MEKVTDYKLVDPNQRQGQKVPRHNELCNGGKGVVLSGCVETQGQEGEEGICSAVKGKRCVSENTSKQLLHVNASACRTVGRKGKLQDLRKRCKTVHREGSETNFNGASSCKKKKMARNRNLRRWSELPEALLDLITKNLGMVDYILFGCVCRSWKLYVAANRKVFMASKAPLILLLSPWARRSCYFYNLFDHKISKALLPSLEGKTCVGITGGYLVMVNKNMKVRSPVWLVNPITRHELHFPRTPRLFERVILASLSMPREEFIIVGFSFFSQFLQFCRPTDDHWTICRIEIPPNLRRWHFVDGAFFKGKIYFLTDHGEIVQFDPRSPPFYNILEVQGITKSLWSMQLVPSDDQLLVVRQDCTIYKLEPLTKFWTKVETWEDEALFCSDTMLGKSAFCPKNKWEGSQNAHKSVFHLLDFGLSLSVRTSDGISTKFVAIKPKGGAPIKRMSTPFWYFPQLACNVDILDQ